MKDENNFKIYLKEISKYKILSKQELKNTTVDQLIKQGLRLVIHIAKRYKKPGIDLVDLIQAGNTGLVMAANNFDPNKRCSFSSWAGLWIEGKIQNYLNANKRSECPTSLDVKYRDRCLVDYMPDKNVNYYNIINDNITLKSAIKKLTEKEQNIINIRFGIHDRDPKTLKEVGEIFCKSYEWVRQIEIKALNKLKKLLT